MSKKKMITRTATMTVDGTVDLDAALTTHCDSVIKAIYNEGAVTLSFVADGTGAGFLDETNDNAIVFHFEDGVTTVGDFENAVTASRNLAVVTPGTLADLLVAGLVGAGGDEFAATSMATGTMSANADACVIDISDMKNVSIYLNQLTDASTVVIKLEKTIDGTNFAVLDASTAESDFPAGNNKSVEFTLSDANGMPTLAKQVKATVTAYGGGVYSMTACGEIDA